MPGNAAAHAMPGEVSSLGDDDFQVLARHYHCAVVGFIHALDERTKVFPETFLLGRLERRKGLEHRTVVGSEHVYEVFRRAVAEIELARLGLDPAGSGSEQFGEARACAPEHWILRRRRRRQILADRLEQLADEPIRRPVRETDPP